MVLRSQFFEYLRETLYRHALEHLEAARSEKKLIIFLFLPKRPIIIYCFEGPWWSGHIFDASTSPRSFKKKLAMSPSSTVHGGQYDTKYVTVELILHAAFVADEIW